MVYGYIHKLLNIGMKGKIQHCLIIISKPYM